MPPLAPAEAEKRAFKCLSGLPAGLSCRPMGKNWTEVRVIVPYGWGELVAGLFAASPFTGVAFGPSSLASEPLPEGLGYLRAYVPSDHDSDALRQGVRKRLDELAESVGDDELVGLPVRFHPLPEEDWANSWKKSWKPFRCGDIAVVPKHYNGPVRETDKRLVLDPGGVFGTGRHATTRTCIKVIQARMRGGESVLDAGCGTGILAGVALLSGARRVVGFDLDPSAASHFDELMTDNNLSAQATFRAGGFEVLRPDEQYDVVVANIYSDIIQDHARDLRRVLKSDGWFVFSGCPVHHAVATRKAIAASGLVIEAEHVRGLWHSFEGVRG